MGRLHHTNVDVPHKNLVVDSDHIDFIGNDADVILPGQDKLARRGSVIIVDNVVRRGAVADADSKDAMVQGVRRFNEQFSRDPRVSITALQTVGGKGYDGLAIALVTGDPG